MGPKGNVQGGQGTGAVASPQGKPLPQRMQQIDGELGKLDAKVRNGKPLSPNATPPTSTAFLNSTKESDVTRSAKKLFAERDRLSAQQGIPGVILNQPGKPPAVAGGEWVNVPHFGWALQQGIGDDCKNPGAKRTIVTHHGAKAVEIGLPPPFPGFKWQITRTDGPASALGLHTYEATLAMSKGYGDAGKNGFEWLESWGRAK